MIETPELFLAADCSSLADVREVSRNPFDSLLFEPGFPAFQVLCAVVMGTQPAKWSNDDSGLLKYLDGPPDPMADEGFQLFRVADEVTRRLAQLTRESTADIVAAWLHATRSCGFPAGEPAAIDAALVALASLARRGQESGRALFVIVLYR